MTGPVPHSRWRCVPALVALACLLGPSAAALAQQPDPAPLWRAYPLSPQKPASSTAPEHPTGAIAMDVFIAVDASSSDRSSELLAAAHPAQLVSAPAKSSFGDAISVQATVFPGYYIAVIRASELTGQLDEAFEQLAAYMQRDINARDIEAWKKVASDAKIEVK